MSIQKTNHALNAKVTVVVPAYNHSRFIFEALDSVKNQTYTHWRLIIIDDGSTDDTWELIKSYKKNVDDDRISIFQQNNLGSHAAINRGMQLADTPYIAILNSDDFFTLDRLEKLVGIADINPQGVFIVSGIQLVDEYGKSIASDHWWQRSYRNLLDRWSVEPTKRVTNPALDVLLWGNFTISTSNFFISNTLWKKVGKFKNLRYVLDWDYALRVASEEPISFIFLPNEILLNYRLHGKNTILNGRIRNHAESIGVLREALKKILKTGYQVPSFTLDRLHHLYRSLRHYNSIQLLEDQKSDFQLLLDSKVDELNQNLIQVTEAQKIDFQLLLDSKLDELIGEFKKSEERSQSEIDRLRLEIDVRQNQINLLLASFPIRTQITLLKFKNKVDHWINSSVKKIFTPFRFFNKIISNIIHQIWLSLPISLYRKQNFKHFTFSRFSYFFKWTQAYDRWLKFTVVDNESREIFASKNLNYEPMSPGDSFVPVLQDKNPPKSNLPIRLIAFYLPQFHVIPENDKWWGAGFTEWTNVKPAQPQFQDHYQPRIPGELGYYDLIDVNVQRRQIDLAKLYGVSAFCFYTYWFGGKLLLEKPVENYLENTSLDLPFCLCWANENWTRRWDGLDSHTLIVQQHSDRDDLAFISYLKKYFDDIRYVRVDGKPLLIVYRPNILPDAKKTAERWRNWCRENGVGEILIAYVQSFESVDPKNYGFDVAIEFPPNNLNPPIVVSNVVPLHKDFNCSVYDWSFFVRRSKNYQVPDYKLFRGVNPSWDNTARRKNKSSVLLNSSPRGYQEWLFNASNDTCSRFVNLDERIVFVNAWNEWAEGAYLEPDERYGYSYLEATRMALLRSSLSMKKAKCIKAETIAFVVHAYYRDVFIEILSYLGAIKIFSLKIYVTTVLEHENFVKTALTDKGFNFTILIVENRGRDILPFLKVMPDVISAGHDFFIKIHTKKSLHRSDGDKWRNGIYSKLIVESEIEHIILSLQNNPDIGIVAPEGHLVKMNYYWGSNARSVAMLSARLGISVATLSDLCFVAGSMFVARTDVVIPILNLAIQDSDFEDELGQVDGTLAHAIERLFSISAHSVGLTTRCCGNNKSGDYEYADRSLI